jgi:hypothetical protein
VQSRGDGSGERITDETTAVHVSGAGMALACPCLPSLRENKHGQPAA